MEMIFSTCSTNFLIHVCRILKRQSLLHQTYKYQPCFHGTSLHLTELTDDISLCSYLIEHIYLSAFYKKNHNCDDQKAVVIMVIVFECIVCYYVACSPWDHHSDSSV